MKKILLICSNKEQEDFFAVLFKEKNQKLQFNNEDVKFIICTPERISAYPYINADYQISFDIVRAKSTLGGPHAIYNLQRNVDPLQFFVQKLSPSLKPAIVAGTQEIDVQNQAQAKPEVKKADFEQWMKQRHGLSFLHEFPNGQHTREENIELVELTGSDAQEKKATFNH